MSSIFENQENELPRPRSCIPSQSASGMSSARDGVSQSSNSTISSNGPDACAACQVKKRSPGSVTCSRRCAWAMEGLCPQCGRSGVGKGAISFCSFSCARVSAQANWCPGCAIRQAPPHQQHCSDACVALAPNVDNLKRSKKTGSVGSSYAHEWVNSRSRTELRMMQLSSLGHQHFDLLRIGVPAHRRRQYLNYRHAVEQRLVLYNLPKYGHGGEGNELRRYLPLRFSCSLTQLASGGAHCGDDACDVCHLLRDGFSLSTMQRASHYGTTTPMKAYHIAAPNESDGRRAVVAVRAVVGCPQMLTSSDQIEAPWEEGFDSAVVSNGNEADDGTYLFCDLALDPLFLIFMA